MIKKAINKILGDPNQKSLKRIRKIVLKINQIEKEYKSTIKDQNDVLSKTSEFKTRLKNGEDINKILPEAYALVKIACAHLSGKTWKVREKDVTWNMVPYDVQLVGGIALHEGNIAEMKTGEGKTLVCTMPAYLNALTEKGVFVVTVNEYLAQRDAEWMKGVYNYLGLSVGVINSKIGLKEKKEAYKCDITYGTNNEFGFDYLRDNMATNKENIVQRNLHYSIIDEVDSILIDEARTPLIISAPAEQSTDKYIKYAKLIPQLKEETHYIIEEKEKTATLTEEGIQKMEKLLGLENIYTQAGFSEVHHIEQALRAYTCYKPDVDYIKKDNQIIIIDEFTGRLMDGRRYSKGLHQAIEAKENVEIKRESKTLATVTFQNYFRMFDKISGMTGTAATEAEEFYQIYGLDTIIIPTNKPIARIDKTDSIYKSQKGKLLAIVQKIKEIHQANRPILVGTISVKQSEVISQLLKLEGIKHNVLNAKQHEREAEIVENAGKEGAVTIATNMAGRGTDIKLTEDVIKMGGLFVLGTSRHESRRIDNQLRGRSGRQGDNGESQFYVSMEDDIMRLFGGEKIKNMMTILKIPENMPIENRMISRSIESAQKKVEGRNFDIRKHLVEYDDVMNIHRKIIYKQRQELLKKEEIKDEIQEMIKTITERAISNFTEARIKKEWDTEKATELITKINNSQNKEEILKIFEQSQDQFASIKSIQEKLLEAYDKKEKELEDPKTMRQIEKAVALRATDHLWTEHINTMSNLREDVAFSGYAQKDPLTEYKAQGFDMFQQLNISIKQNTITTLFNMDLEKVVPSQMLKNSESKNIVTNEERISSTLSGDKNNVTHSTFNSTANTNNSNPVIARVNSTNKPRTTKKAGRNEPCPCGSGKKYKKCCGA